jgi:raffinose/stachyose/melibiose transport system substrate-binding protein
LYLKLRIHLTPNFKQGGIQMKGIMKRVLIFMLAAVMLFSIAACGGDSSKDSSTSDKTSTSTDKTTDTQDSTSEETSLGPATFHIFTYNSDEASQGRNEYCIEKIKEVMPEITVEVENMSSGDPTYTKMKTYIAANDVPEFFNVHSVYIDQLIATGQIADLTEQAEKTGFKSEASPIGIKLGTYKDKIYTFPGISLSFAMIYYNKEIFANNNIEVPVTYDEFLDVVKTLRAKGITPIGLMGKDKWPFSFLLDIFASRYNYNASEDVLNGKMKFTDEPYLKAAQKVQELAKAGAFSEDAMLKDYTAASAEFNEGKYAMLVNGSWAFTEIGAGLGYDKLGYLYFPVDDASQAEESKIHWTGGDGSPVGWSYNPNKFKTPEEHDRAAKFLYYWAKFTCEKFALGGNPVVTMKVDVQPEGGYPEIIQKWQQDYNNIVSSPIYMCWNVPAKAQSTFNDGVQKLATGMYDPAEFCADMQKALDEAR